MTGNRTAIDVGTPDPEQRLFAGLLDRALNRRAGAGGRWTVRWTDPAPLPPPLIGPGRPTRLEMAWFDCDGDLILVVDAEEPMARYWRAGLDHWVDQCLAAHRAWHDHERDLEIAPWQKKRA